MSACAGGLGGRGGAASSKPAGWRGNSKRVEAEATCWEICDDLCLHVVGSARRLPAWRLFDEDSPAHCEKLLTQANKLMCMCVSVWVESVTETLEDADLDAMVTAAAGECRQQVWSAAGFLLDWTHTDHNVEAWQWHTQSHTHAPGNGGNSIREAPFNQSDESYATCGIKNGKGRM